MLFVCGKRLEIKPSERDKGMYDVRIATPLPNVLCPSCSIETFSITRAELAQHLLETRQLLLNEK